MRAAAILGPGNVSRAVANFERLTGAEWTSLLEQADIAVVFGGDGTVHRHLAELVEADVPLLVVPCGSGNDFARALGISNRRVAAAAWRKYAADGSNLRTIDLGVISAALDAGAPIKRHFCCIAGMGIDTKVASRANALPRWLRSRGGYALSTPQELARFAPLLMKISPDLTAASFRPTILATIANTPYFGGGMKIAPQAKLDDGKLDLCVIRGMNTLKRFCLLPTVYFGRHLGFKEVEYAQAGTVQVETEHPIDVYADGEYVCQTPAIFSLAEQGLKVILPDDRLAAPSVNQCYTTEHL
jgi:YegS/Rv2252/BmrU family lipid kinase